MSSTLNRLVSLEEQLANTKAALEQIQTKLTASGLDSAKNETASGLKALQNVAGQLNHNIGVLSNKISGIETALAAVGKLVNGMTKVLIDKGIMTDAEVLDKVREFDDQTQQTQIEGLEKAGYLKVADAATAESIVIFRQEEVMPDESHKLVSDYRVLDMTSAQDNDPLKTEMLNKAAGHVFVYNQGDAKYRLIVKSVYSMVEVKPGEGEQQPAQQ